MLELVARLVAMILGPMLLGIAHTTPAQQQTGSRLEAIRTVMSSRAGQMGDLIPFDACSVYEQAGRPVAMMDSLRYSFRDLLDRPVNDPCAQEPPSALPGLRRIVRVDSLMLTDSVAYVHLTVVRGEYSYREQHILPAYRGRPGWGWREARVYAGLQGYPGFRARD